MGIKSNNSEESYYNYFAASGHDAGNPPAGKAETTAATGGTKTTVGDWAYHEFTSPGDFVVTDAPGTATLYYLVVGGGGGGGNSGVPSGGGAGGGGAGGLLSNHPSIPAPLRGGSYSYGPGTYGVVIGAGGAGGSGNNADGSQGGNSSFNPGGTGSPNFPISAKLAPLPPK